MFSLLKVMKIPTQKGEQKQIYRVVPITKRGNCSFWKFKPQSKASNSRTDLKLPQALIAQCSVCLNVVFYKLLTNLDPLYLSKF